MRARSSFFELFWLSRRVMVSGGVTVMLAALLVGCTETTPTYRYRMTVEVETPEGPRTGSSVIEVDTSVGRSSMNPAGTAITHRVRGEAAAVDLPGGRTLFALLRSEDDVDYAARIMFLLAPKGRLDGDQFLGTFANMLEMEGPIELPATQEKINRLLADKDGRPMLVTFGDLADPTSVERVDPDDLAATFGEGFALRRITVQMTDDAVTNAIGERLAWLGEYPEPSLKANHDLRDFSLPATLHHGDLRRGLR